MNKVIRKIEKSVWDFLHFGRKFYWRTFNVKTFGVRVLLYDESKQKFFLVKHRYGNLWVFPGGGMKKDEDPFLAGKRELLEEANIEVFEFNGTLGVYKNKREGKDDTVTVIVANKWIDHGRKKNFEIKDSGWFGLEELPESTSGATRRRVEEFLSLGTSLIEGDW